MLTSNTLQIVVAILASIAALQPALSALAGITPPAYAHAISAVISIAGMLHLYLSESPLQHAIGARRAAAQMAKRAAAMIAGGSLLVLVAGCAFLKSNQAAIVAGVEGAIPIACDLVEAIDPAIGGIMCAVLDAGGNIVAELPTVTAPIDDARAFVAAHPSLKAARAKAKINRMISAEMTF
jgi:hypothetical protein